MNCQKLVLAEIEKCYAATAMMIKGEPWLFFAGEGNGSLQAFHGQGFKQLEKIWTGGGGTMSVVPLQEEPPMLLASRGFYSMVEAQTSTIEIIRMKNGASSHQTIARLPYLHRFDVLTAPDGVRYILAASIASFKENKEDWSHPGHLYCGRLPDKLDEPFEVSLRQLPGDYYINHGFCKARVKEEDIAFTSSREGIFSVKPPASANGAWTIEKLFDEPVSDIAVCDIDSDGEIELAAIMPFHGNLFKVYKKQGESLKEIYAHPDENDFYHTVISGTLDRQPVFVGGARKLSANLFILNWDQTTQSLTSCEIDRGGGPSNAYLFNAPGEDLLLSANRMIAEAAVYRFSK